MRPQGTFFRSCAGRRPSLFAAALAVGLISLGAPPAAFATKDVDLAAQSNVTFTGRTSGDLTGAAVADAGDFNGDGINDIIMGARLADVPGLPGKVDAGAVYIVYGKAHPTSVSLADLAAGPDSRGLEIDGGAPNDRAGQTVEGIGDFNGDSTDDVIIGARGVDQGADLSGGAAYVIYGDDNAPGNDPADLDLGQIRGSDPRGMEIQGPPVSASANAGTGLSAHAAGDINADGFKDVAVDSIFADYNSKINSGAAWVIYGGNTADPADVNLANVFDAGLQNDRGFRVVGATAGDQAGSSTGVVGNVPFAGGDFNNDGTDDLAVGAVSANSGSGIEYVVYGDPGPGVTHDPGDVNLATDTSRFMSVSGLPGGGGAFPPFLGASGVGIADFNNDGDGDLLVGAPDADGINGLDSGLAFVVYSGGPGDMADVNLVTDTGSFMRMDGAGPGDLAGGALTPADDMNGDDRGDLAVGAVLADPNGRADSGAVYAIYRNNQGDPSDIDLGQLKLPAADARGYEIDGEATNDRLGASIAPVLDLNLDSVNELLIGANQQNPPGTGSGRAYITSAAPPTATAAPASLTFGSRNVGAGPSSSQHATLTNDDPEFFVRGDVLQIEPPGSAPDFPLSNDGCGAPPNPTSVYLAPGGSCGIDVQFEPQASGSRTADLRFNDEAGNSPQLIPVSGTGLDPQANLSPTSVTLPDTNVGTQSGPSTVTVTNNGTDPLLISSITLAGADPGEFELDTHSCVGTLAPGAHCDVDVALHPTTRGNKNAVVRFTDDANNSPQDATLSGLAVDPGISIPAQTTFSARNVGTVSPAQTVTATNSGQDPLNISTIEVTGGNAAEFSTSNDTCTGASLNPAQTCTVDVTFAPTTRGPKASTLRFHDNANGNLHDVQLVGAGESPALTVTPHDGLDYGLVEFSTQSDPQSLAVENTGPDPITLSAVSVTGPDAASFAKGADSCEGQTLSPSQACAVEVRFTPASVGTQNASLQIDSTAIGGPTVVPLAGIGQENVPPPIAGNRAVGAVESGTVLIKKPTDSDFNSVEAGSVVRIPVNTVVDTTNGEIALVSEKDHKTGATRVGRFSQGVFRFFQRDVRRPITEIILAGGGSCPVTAGKPKGRKIFGDAGGGHRTSGAYGAATVRGTQWLTEDVCGPNGQLLGTRISTVEGKVQVNNFRNRKTKIVNAGHSVLIAATP
ncbi:MAG: hypothetical protein QOG62_254 [Thermoleophilaceae bacterium]|nr:hypothetical protein [Thermoleophilaceae bacterium]